MRRAYPRLWGRRVVLLLSAGVTVFAATSVIKDAVGEALVAEDIEYDDAIPRITPYGGNEVSIPLAGEGGEGDLAYEIVDAPTMAGERVGTATIVDDSAVVAVDREAPAGPAQFTYAAVDESGVRSADATVSFEIANRSPLTRDLTLTTTRDEPLDIWPYLRDAEDGGPFVWRRDGNRVTYSDPAHGSIEPFFGADGSEPEFAQIDHKVVYVPDPGYVGADSFTYTFTDEDGAASTSTISVDVVEPRPASWGGVDDVRYRCALHVKTDENGRADSSGAYDTRATRRLSKYLGGDLVLVAAASIDAPRELAPSESYTLGDVRLRLTIQPGLADLLAGAPAGRGHDLADVGFGQSSVAAESSMSLQVSSTADGGSREMPVTGLASEPVATSSRTATDGIELRFTGVGRGLLAPQSGAVAVSLPQVFLVDLELEPGLRGRDKYVGLRCYAPADARRTLARIPVSPGGRLRES